MALREGVGRLGEVRNPGWFGRRVDDLGLGYHVSFCFFFSSRRRHTRCYRDWSSDVCSSDLYAREHMPPAEYLATTYYEHWLYGLERLLVEKGLVTGKELEAMRPQGPVAGVKALGVADLPKALRNRRAARMDDHLATPRFKAGDCVRTTNLNPTGPTRLPRYARDERGVIDRDHGVFIFADAHA